MKNLKEWKTTILGAICIGVVIADMWRFKTLEEIGLAAVALVGIGLLVAPDKVINNLMDKLKGGGK